MKRTDGLSLVAPIGGQSFDMIPIPLDYDGQVEITLKHDGTMGIIGTRVHLELIGTPTYVEELPGNL